MNNSRPIVNISLLLGTIMALSAFFLVFNNIPVQALHKEEQLLESFDDLADFAKAVRNGDADIEEIPIQSMKAADIYDDADDTLKDCIDQAAEIGDSLTDREVVHCVDDVNYFNNKYSNIDSTVPTTATSTATTDFRYWNRYHINFRYWNRYHINFRYWNRYHINFRYWNRYHINFRYCRYHINFR